MQDTHKTSDATDFAAWMAEMDFNSHGGQAKAAEALGKSRDRIRDYQNGAAIPRDTRLAMTALAQDLHPWDAKTHGLPKLHVGLSVDWGGKRGKDGGKRGGKKGREKA